MTYRERREARAERLSEWAEKREAKAQAAYTQTKRIADMIPFGQPILVGHHSEGRARKDQARIVSGMAATVEHGRKAEEFASRASGIQAQLDNSIYSDDADAIERLEERIASLEAERQRIKDYNASCRKGNPDESLLDERQRADIANIRRVCAYQLGKNGQFPGYATTNLGGNINRNKKRLEELKQRAVMQETGDRGAGRQMLSRYGGTCPDCGEDFAKGDSIVWYRITREAVCESCA